jgi:methyl-accepting chemotaxis protein
MDNNTQVMQHQKYMLYFVGANIPIFLAVALYVGHSAISSTIIQCILFGLILAGRTLAKKDSTIGLDLSAIAIVLTPAVLVYALEGEVGQLDAHMYFFATLAMLTGFKSIRAALIGTVAIAVHHLALNFLMPFALYPEGADFMRVVFHAVIVLVEAAVIVLTIRGLQQSDIKITKESEAGQPPFFNPVASS